jgi:hypothetical protein
MDIPPFLLRLYAQDMGKAMKLFLSFAFGTRYNRGKEGEFTGGSAT